MINRKDLILPGFDKNGQSWLYNSINRCRNVGRFIAEIETIQNRLKSKYQYEIDWLNWIDKHFITLDESNSMLNLKKEKNNLSKLAQLVRKLQYNEPSMADIVMMGQLHDCCEELGINRMSDFSKR